MKKKNTIEYMIMCAGSPKKAIKGRAKHRPHKVFKNDKAKAIKAKKEMTAHAKKYKHLYYDDCLPYTMFTRTITEWEEVHDSPE